MTSARSPSSSSSLNITISPSRSKLAGTHDVHGFVEHDLLAGPSDLEVDLRADGDPHLASRHGDIGHAVVQFLQEDAVATGRFG